MEFNLLINRDINDYEIDCILNSSTLKDENSPYGKKANEVLKKLNYDFEHDYKRYKLFDDNDIVVDDNLDENLKVKKILTVRRYIEKNDNRTNIYLKAFNAAIKLGLKSIAIFFYDFNGLFNDKYDIGLTNVLSAVDKINENQRGALKIYLMLNDRDGIMINKKIFFKDNVDSKSPFIDYYKKDNGSNDIFYTDHKTMDDMNIIKSFVDSLDEKKFIKIDHELTYPFEFLEILFEGKENEFNKLLKECNLDRRRKNRLKNTKNLNKETVISLSIALGLNKELTYQFLMIAGYSFSMYEKLDMLVIKYFMDYKVSNFELFDNIVMFQLGRHLKF